MRGDIEIELLPPADYLRMTYYERWLRINEQLLVKHGLVTPNGTRRRRAGSRIGESDPGLKRGRCSQPSWSRYPFQS